MKENLKNNIQNVFNNLAKLLSKVRHNTLVFIKAGEKFNFSIGAKITSLAVFAAFAILGSSQLLDAQAPGTNPPATTTTSTKTLPKDTKTRAVKQNLTEEDIIRANFGMKLSGEGIQFDLLNDFENCEDWRAVATTPLGDTRVRKVEGKPDNQIFEDEKKILEKFRDDMNKRRREAAEQFAKSEGKKSNLPATLDPTKIDAKYILGIRTYFQEGGFDRVEVSPPNEYIIKGKAKEIRVWALGRKFRHSLYVKLRDYRGRIHKLKMGNLNYFGWKRLKVTIPGWLPQSSRYALLDKNLHFVSFFVVSDRFENPGSFFFYLDNFSIVTDMAENQYDGSEILDTW